MEKKYIKPTGMAIIGGNGGSSSLLPDLPKKKGDAEAKFGLEFRKWVSFNYPKLMSCTFELKDTDGGDSLRFAEVGELQRMNGLRTKSDKGNLVRVQTGTPGAADYSYHRKAPAWVVIRYPKSFEMIDIETFIEEDRKSKRRSLTAERAKEISVLSVKIR